MKVKTDDSVFSSGIAESNSMWNSMNNVRAKSRPLGDFLRVQIIAVFMVQAIAAFATLPFHHGIEAVQEYVARYPQFLHTILYFGCAGAVGVWTIRQLNEYPGTKIAVYFVPCLLLPYSLVALIAFAFRLDYIRPAVLASFAGSLSWVFFDYLIRLRRREVRLLLVPGGNMRGIDSAPGVKTHFLRDTSEQTKDANMIVADLHYNHQPDWERFITRCVLAGIPLHDAKSVIEHLSGKVEFEHLSENSFGAVLPSNTYLKLKYLIDLTIALFALPLVSMAIAIAAMLVVIESGRPVFFRQERMGFRGRLFCMLKLRSMYNESPPGDLFTRTADSRVTKVGRIIRKYRIDELPQIWNVIKGDMSWIGPRPEATKLANWYEREIPFYMYRHAVRPGITGWAQVNQGNVGEIHAATEKLRYDFYYIKHFSPWLDVLIAMRTVRTVLVGFGSK